MNDKGQFASFDDAEKVTCQHTTPCADCPWRRSSLNMWLGALTKDEWVRVAHSDSTVDCHTKTPAQCAGIAIYRRNVAKMAYPPNLRLEKDTSIVFATPFEFLEHHSKLPGNR